MTFLASPFLQSVLGQSVLFRCVLCVLCCVCCVCCVCVCVVCVSCVCVVCVVCCVCCVCVLCVLYVLCFVCSPTCRWTALFRTALFRTALPRTAQNFAFFFPSPVPSLLFLSLSLSGCLLVDRDSQMCTFGLSGCRVKPRHLRGRGGFTRQSENS